MRVIFFLLTLFSLNAFAAYIPKTVTTNSTSKTHIESAIISSGNSFSGHSTNWLSSVSWASNVATITFASSQWGAAPDCVVSNLQSDGSRRRVLLQSTTTTAAVARTWWDESSALAAQFNIICFGTRP